MDYQHALQQRWNGYGSNKSNEIFQFTFNSENSFSSQGESRTSTVMEIHEVLINYESALGFLIRKN